jgi:hypothetical protein
LKQRAHAWIAYRALKLLDETCEPYVKSLVELLSFYLSDVWEGAWLPDSLIRDIGYGHIYKMDNSDEFIEKISTKKHRIVPNTKLKKDFDGKRLCLEYVQDEQILNKPYWVNDESGRLPDRVIAISHSIIDMLKMADFPLAFYAKEVKAAAYKENLSKQKIKDLSLSPNYSARQIALTFFLASHYIADAHVPVHCDLRDYNAKKLDGTRERRLPKPLHSGIEAAWEKSMPTVKKLAIHDYTKDSLEDLIKLPRKSIVTLNKNNSDYALKPDVYANMRNEWNEANDICRVSYAVSKKWVPYSYKEIERKVGEDECKKTEFNEQELLKVIPKKEFEDVTNRIFHDAVESVARLWYRSWKIYCKPK